MNDGYHGSLTRYDFRGDHGLGGTDHRDAEVTRFVEGQIGYVPDVPSHLVYDEETGLVYAVDTGNNRIVALDPTTGTDAGPTAPNYDGSNQRATVNSDLWTHIDGAAVGLVRPSGLEIHECFMFVSDNATSTIYAFTMDGELVDWLDTGLPSGALMGMAFDPADGSLFIVDAMADNVLRIAPR